MDRVEQAFFEMERCEEVAAWDKYDRDTFNKSLDIIRRELDVRAKMVELMATGIAVEYGGYANEVAFRYRTLAEKEVPCG